MELLAGILIGVGLVLLWLRFRRAKTREEAEQKDAKGNDLYRL